MLPRNWCSGPKGLAVVIKESIRILELAIHLFHHAGIEHVLRTAALSGEQRGAVVKVLHHVALGLQLGARHHRPVGGHDLGLVIGQFEQIRHRIDPTAEPAAGVQSSAGSTQW
ncbi:MAG: hypothetical protein WDM77_21160 [Steroidobacteraceae bacterium]